MRIFKLALPVLAVLFLSACNTWQGFKDDWDGVQKWSNGDPNTRSWIGPAPTGYAGQNPKQRILKPYSDESELEDTESSALEYTDGVTLYPIESGKKS